MQRPGLALTGFTDYIRYGRVQIMGSSELGYLRTLAPARRRAVLARLGRCRITCFIVTKGLGPPPELKAECQARGIPLLLTPADSTPSSSSSPRSSTSAWPCACTCTRCWWTCSAWAC